MLRFRRILSTTLILLVLMGFQPAQRSATPSFCQQDSRPTGSDATAPAEIVALLKDTPKSRGLDNKPMRRFAKEWPACFVTALKRSDFRASFARRVGTWNAYGWDDTGKSARIVGAVADHHPLTSTDGFMTIDMQIEQIWIDDVEYTAALTATRFLRIELGASIHHQLPESMQASAFWTPGLRASFSGRLYKDNDENPGFYEIHPTSAADVQILDQP